MREIGVIGGGAAGMMAAIMAAREGANVTILEHTSRVGTKILSTGNGKCNLTNVNQKLTNYHGTNPDFVVPVFEKFGLPETIQFFLELGIYTKNRNGGLYPNSEQASSVLDVLRMELVHQNIQVITDCVLSTLQKEKERFQAVTKDNQVYTFDRIIIAAGSKAAPKTGSDGSGYKLAKKLGVHIIKPVPALTQLKSSVSFLTGLNGVRCDALLTLEVNGEAVLSDRGELQLTDYGISGIPTFQLSGLAGRAMLEKENQVSVSIDFMPDFEEDVLYSFLQIRTANREDKTCEEMLTGLFNKKLISYFLRECGIKGSFVCGKLGKEEYERLCEVIKHTTIPVDSVNDENHAQVCSGGVDTSELTKCCESKVIKGLYFAGEIIDIDGLCGGYNLQWAWSSGAVAGKSAAND